MTVQDVRTARAHLLRLIKYTGCQVILDHYLVRDRNFRRLYQEVYAAGQVQTAAEFLGRPERLLEARRRDQESREVTRAVSRHMRTFVGAGQRRKFEGQSFAEAAPDGGASRVSTVVAEKGTPYEEALSNPTPCL